MLHFAKPKPTTLDSYLTEQRVLNYSYELVGGTKTNEVPEGFDSDCSRVLLGYGERVFDAACQLVREWKMMPRPWTAVYPAKVQLVPEAAVVVIARAFCCWWSNSARIVYTVDQQVPTKRFGFAYGTLPGHVETGEERFLVEWDSLTDQVWYELVSFSQPRHPLVRWAYPLARRLQAKFARESSAQMKRLVDEAIRSSSNSPTATHASV